METGTCCPDGTAVLSGAAGTSVPDGADPNGGILNGMAVPDPAGTGGAVAGGVVMVMRPNMSANDPKRTSSVPPSAIGWVIGGFAAS